LSLFMNAAVVMDCFSTRQYDAGVERGRRAVELDENFFASQYYLGLVCEQAGRIDEAVTLLENARLLSHDCPLVMAGLGGALAAAGRHEDARGILRELDDLARTSYVSATMLAVIHIGLGDRARALDLLDRAFDARCVWLLRALRGDPRFDPLRDDARFQRLAERIPEGRGE